MAPVLFVLPLKDKFTQKCVIPIRFFENVNFKIKDFVTIRTSVRKYICRVFITKLPKNCIFVDDIVTASNSHLSESSGHWETTNILNDLEFIKPSIYDRIVVKIIIKDNENVVHCDKTVYEEVTHKILASFVIEKDCVVTCNGLNLANFFHIHTILVCETFPEIHKYGKLLKASKVEVIAIKSKDQICQINEFRYKQLGGISDIHNILKLNLIETSDRILVTGPTGCGKSSFIKWFCSNTECYFEVLDGLKITDLTSDKCQIIQKRFSSCLKMFPNSLCILFIDHLDVIAPYELKQKSLMFAFVLMDMINYLKNMNVFVIAAAVQKNNINPKVSSLFIREINLGIPSHQQRKEILKCLTNSLRCDIDHNKIAQMTPGFVAYDICSLVQESINMKKKNGNAEKVELNMNDFEAALDSISPSILKTSVWNIKVKPIYWKDIGGMFNIKQRLQMCIEQPLLNPDIFKKVNLPCPRGVLLFGPPGCCKTTLARGLATECNANFFAANSSQIYSLYVGESEKNITELFSEARICAPSIIFLDELDSLVGQRKLDKKSQGIGEKVLSALLNEMDGIGTKVQFKRTLNMQKLLNTDEIENLQESGDMEYNSSDEVIVVAATNRPDLIDDALLRPGRFDIILYVPPPNIEERESILQTLTKDMPVEDVDLKNIAENTDLFSGADLKNLYYEAAMNALRKNRSASCITEDNFKEALKKIKPSITRQQIEMYEKLSHKYGTIIK